MKIGVGILLFFGEKLLVCKMADKANNPECSLHWLFPGGKYDKEEGDKHYFDTLKREVKEELSLTLPDDRYTGLTILTDSKWKAVYYIAHITKEEFDSIVVCPREFIDHKWMTLDEALSISEPKSHHIEELIKNHIN